MRLTISGKHTALALVTALSCTFAATGVQAEDESDRSILVESNDGDTLWPDIRELHSKVRDASEGADRSDAGAESETVLPPRDPYTQEELRALFGGLPFYFITGSSALNKINNLPSVRLPLSDSDVIRKNGYLIVRPSWTAFEQELTDTISAYQGDWSIYLKDLSTGKTMEINEHSMESASLIKLYIAGTIYEQIEQEKLTETDTITTALSDMITVSDNESSNVLVRAIMDDDDFQSGLAKVNDFAARYGFTNTEQVNGIADPSLWVSDGRVNMTSAADCGRLLEMIYNRELVSHFSSFRFEVLLNKQEIDYKIPDGLPEGVHISHKTGEVDDTENDAAIIYTPYGDYIFCIMSTDLTDTDTAIDHIHEVTALIYEYFTENAYPLEALSFGQSDENPPLSGQAALF